MGFLKFVLYVIIIILLFIFGIMILSTIITIQLIISNSFMSIFYITMT